MYDNAIAQMAARKDRKFLLLCLEERNGNYEYSHRSVHELPNNLSKTADRIAEDYVSTFYGGGSEHSDGGYYFHNGEVFVRIRSWQFIGKRDFDSLRKYLFS